MAIKELITRQELEPWHDTDVARKLTVKDVFGIRPKELAEKEKDWIFGAKAERLNDAAVKMTEMKINNLYAELLESTSAENTKALNDELSHRIAIDTFFKELETPADVLNHLEQGTQHLEALEV